ncbi:MAG: hypothetical protein HFJ98_00100 [Eubacterium sp.]|nr:hypothetical protein [Eubacterium sp.]
MDKNEILEKSRKENGKQDEYNKDVNKKSAFVAMVSSAAVCFTLMMVEIFLDKGNGSGYLVILTSINVTTWMYKGIKLRDKHYIFISIVWLIAMLASAFNYAMNLAG